MTSLRNARMGLRPDAASSGPSVPGTDGHRISQVGRDEHVPRVVGDILPENVEMLRVCEKAGFALARDLEDAVVRAEMAL